MLINKYIIAYTTGGDDISYEEFDDLEAAQAWLAENEYKALLIKCEDICDAGMTPAKITVEDHT